jgi:MoaA/NifB/PqqE/SkfB family radical SAM enzyme
MNLAELKESNSALLRREVDRGATRLASLPEVVNLNHTNRCNLKCPFCVTTHEKQHHRLSRDVIERVAEALFPTARKVVLTMAGEPLAADFELIADLARRFAVKLDMVTNAVLLTPERYGEIRGLLDHLNVSFDSHVPEVYERLRVGASFAKVHAHLRGIRELREREPDEVLPLSAPSSCDPIWSSSPISSVSRAGSESTASCCNTCSRPA